MTSDIRGQLAASMLLPSEVRCSSMCDAHLQQRRQRCSASQAAQVVQEAVLIRERVLLKAAETRNSVETMACCCFSKILDTWVAAVCVCS